MHVASVTLAATSQASVSVANARAAEAVEAAGVAVRVASEVDHERRRLKLENEQRKLSSAQKGSQLQNVSQQFQR
eukprot:11159438-Lingulodinium_polyedra.AAC.1